MSENKGKKKKGLRNFLMGAFVVIVVLIASLFGDFFPGLNDFRDKLLQNEGYSETNEGTRSVEIPVTMSEVLIQEDTIYYMGEEITLAEFETKLDENENSYITLIDNFATQRTWDSVYNLLDGKGFVINEEIAR